MAKKYITGTHRQTVGQGTLSAKRQGGAPRYVQVSCRSKDHGQAVMGAISTCNPGWTYTKVDSVWGNVLAWGVLPGGSWTTGDWKTFRVRTNSRAESDELVTDIGLCMEECGVDPVDGSIEYTSSDSDNSGTNKNMTLVYVVVGVVLAIVVGIILTKKRK